MFSVDAYFLIPIANYDEVTVKIPKDDGTIIGENINAFIIGQIEDNYLMIVRLEEENLKAYQELLPEGINPFSLEGVAALGITNSYVGLGYSEVRRRWPLLTTPDENGVIKLNNIKILKGV